MRNYGEARNLTKCQVYSSELDILSSFWSIMSSFSPHNNFDNCRNFLHLFEKEKQVCAPDFVEGPHQGFLTMPIHLCSSFCQHTTRVASSCFNSNICMDNTFLDIRLGGDALYGIWRSGLPQGPFWKTISTPLKLGKKWGFAGDPEMGLKWLKSDPEDAIH